MFGQRHCSVTFLWLTLMMIIQLIFMVESTYESANDRRRLKISSLASPSSPQSSSSSSIFNRKQSIKNKSDIFMSNNGDDRDLSPFKDNFFFKRQIIILLIPPNYGQTGNGNGATNGGDMNGGMMPGGEPGGYYGGDLEPPLPPGEEEPPGEAARTSILRAIHNNRNNRYQRYRRPAIATINSYALRRRK